MSNICPLMTTDEIEKGVEELITPECADAQAPIFVRCIYEIANFENPPQANQAKAMALAAFRQTSDYAKTVEAAFQKFVRVAHAEDQIPDTSAGQKKADELQQTTSAAVH